jgi:hypothetical protein
MRSLLILLLLASTAFGEIKTDITKVKVLQGVSNARQAGDFFIIDDMSDPKVTDGALILVTTKAKFVRVRARPKQSFDYVTVDKTPAGYVLAGNGQYTVEVTTFDPNLGIEDSYLTVDLGPVEPEPGPGPDSDKFDKLALRVSMWSRGLKENKKLAECYKTAATKLIDDRSATIPLVSDQLIECRTKTLGSASGDYQKVIDQINSDLKDRWSKAPFTKTLMSEYFAEIARGLSYE